MFALTFSGNLGAEPEFSYTPTGKAVAKLSVAVSAGKDKLPLWVKVTAWERGAEAVANMGLKKGNRVLIHVTKPATIDVYQTKAGKFVASFEVTSDWIEGVSAKELEGDSRKDV